MCEFCTTNEAVEALKRSLDYLDMQLRYCPVCGSPITLREECGEILKYLMEEKK